MPDAKGVRRLECGPTDDTGTTQTLVIRDTDGNDSIFVLDSDKLPTMIINLLRIASHPAVYRHFPESPATNADSTVQLVPLPFRAIGGGYDAENRQTALIITLPGNIQLGFVLSPELAATLRENLEQPDQEGKTPGNKPRLN